jgi:uncharacterized protein (DUF1501 family)
MKQSRRRFLRDSACGLTAAAMVSNLDRFNLVNAMVQQQPEAAADYKALVCIFLYGGTDANNMIVPLDSEYNNYMSVRGLSGNPGTGAGLGIPQSILLPINPVSGRQFGLHPNLSPEVANPAQPFKGLLDVWNQGKLAALCNYGSLVQPITRAQYQANIGHPYQLFSHSDQQTQQQTVVANGVGQTGWGGRLAEKAAALNGSVVLPMNISVSGTSLFATGTLARQLAISAAPTTLANLLVLNWSGLTGANPNTVGSSYRQLLGFDLDSFLVKGASDTTNQALTADAVLNQPDPVVGLFPNTSLGNQLKQVAKLIKIKDTLGMKRQIFFCSLGAFDTHTNQTGQNPASPNNGGANSGAQGGLLTQLSQAMRAFYDEMVAQGVSNNVTSFTLSDFGRTLQPSGTGTTTVGSDHGWGSHAFIMGGAVMGSTFYGAYPTLALGGPNDTDNRGRWIPTTSLDQYAATLATWYGLAPTDVAAVFPNLFKFSPANLGFLG